MPPNPPSNAHGSAMRSMSLRDMQIPKSEQKNSWPPPLLNPGDAPEIIIKKNECHELETFYLHYKAFESVVNDEEHACN